MLKKNGRCNDIGAAEPLYGGSQGEGYQARDDCAEVSFLSWAAFPCSGQKATGHTGYCSAEIQDRHFCQRMLLAWA